MSLFKYDSLKVLRANRCSLPAVFQWEISGSSSGCFRTRALERENCVIQTDCNRVQTQLHAAGPLKANVRSAVTVRPAREHTLTTSRLAVPPFPISSRQIGIPDCTHKCLKHHFLTLWSGKYDPIPVQRLFINRAPNVIQKKSMMKRIADGFSAAGTGRRCQTVSERTVGVSPGVEMDAVTRRNAARASFRTLSVCMRVELLVPV
ncbi:hypothetical protein IRJ41_000651 [Triplophysa rosa]|uniref:Uncharacterized protein n=1 Tax=Triplophysa rosa TaxID=992332 RepID=A0A9W7WU11_TRIRA|nr:hypothetical protein IRJ41_000651 [Triplophysa rosa]